MPATDATSTRTLSEHESKQLLAAHGVPVPEERLAADPDAAVAAAESLGYPVVVKLCGPTIAHKTERGLVRLGLGDGDAVRRAAADLLGAATPADGPVDLLVASMVQGKRELIAGLHHDEQFGRCVMLGVGGILAEAVADVAFRLVPLDEADADELLDDLRTARLLGPFRGDAAVDRAALVATLLGLGRLAEARPDVVAVDVNPLVVTADGTPVPVDALVVVEGDATVAGSADASGGAR